jgi:nicotinate (nicotinamide) nucleotide adenylyltransferase
MINRYILIFGTSANPIHQGHIELIISGTQALLERGMNIQMVVLMPVYRRNPIDLEEKDSLPITFEHRYSMCQLAAREVTKHLATLGVETSVSRLEAELSQKTSRPNFTAETLEVMRASTDLETGFILFLGEDAFSGGEPPFSRWHQVEKIFHLAVIAISPRPDFQANQAFLNELKDKNAQIIYLDKLNIREISSRQIRSRLASGEDPMKLFTEGLLSKEIAQYIKEKKLVSVWSKLKLIDPDESDPQHTCQ